MSIASRGMLSGLPSCNKTQTIRYALDKHFFMVDQIFRAKLLIIKEDKQNQSKYCIVYIVFAIRIIYLHDGLTQ